MGRVRKLKLKFNLSELFGETIPDDAGLREAIGGAIIERIRERTQDGVDKNGRKFKKYSEAYKNSADFAAFGKNENEVNMTLSGDMLGSLDIIEQTKQTIAIGFADDDQNVKAFNHVTGDTVPQRDFFGLPKKELMNIVEEFRPVVEDLKQERLSESKIDFKELATKYLEGLARFRDEGNDDGE